MNDENISTPALPPPRERALNAAMAILQGYETTDEMVIEAARVVDEELREDFITINRQRQEILGLMGAIFTRSFFGKPLEYWQQADTRIGALQNEGVMLRRQVASANHRAGQYRDMLEPLIQLPFVKKGTDENIVGAVLRYVGELQSKAADAAVAFRALCQKHNIVTPCESFLGTEPGGTTCGNCGHPLCVHPWPNGIPLHAGPASTEAAS